jgi:hypothetical protein
VPSRSAGGDPEQLAAAYGPDRARRLLDRVVLAAGALRISR